MNNIYKSGELIENSTCSILEHMGPTRIQRYQTQYYNLDAILSVGYRVNSKNATQFRIWANKILKSFLLKGYAIQQKFEYIDDKLDQHDKALFEQNRKIELFIRTNLPPHEGIFFDGQIFEAYAFVANIIRTAKKSIVLIDNFIDESVLTLLTKRGSNVIATIYTSNISKQLQLDLKMHNTQYPTIEIKIFTKSHDRFIIIDNTNVFHIGASLKDLGKKWFAFSKIELDANELLERLENKL